MPAVRAHSQLLQEPGRKPWGQPKQQCPNTLQRLNHELHLAWKSSTNYIFFTQGLPTSMEFHLYGIEKRIYSNFTRRFPLQPWVFGLSIVITCNTQGDISSSWVGVQAGLRLHRPAQETGTAGTSPGAGHQQGAVLNSSEKRGDTVKLL